MEALPRAMAQMRTVSAAAQTRFPHPVVPSFLTSLSLKDVVWTSPKSGSRQLYFLGGDIENMFEQPTLPQALNENNGYLGAVFGLDREE